VLEGGGGAVAHGRNLSDRCDIEPTSVSG
jgi:hypothetical protein